MKKHIGKNKGGFNMSKNLSQADKALLQFNKSQRYRDQVNKIKKELRRKASMANKRLTRLENNDLKELPAYRQWREYGGGKKFSSAGKDYNQLQAELARVDRFLESRTSLVRESNKYMKEIASLTGAKYDKVSDLPRVLNNFFELASKVEQYLRQVEGSASAIGYQKIWDTINKYTQDQEIDLKNINKIAEGMIENIGYGSLYEEIDDYWQSIT